MSEAASPQRPNPLPDGGDAHPMARIPPEAARERAESWFEQVVEAAPDAMILVGQEGQILVVNQQCERIFGYAREELIGKSIEILVPVRFRELHRKQRTEFTAAPRSRPLRSGLELSALRRDGTEFPAEISLSPIADPLGAVIACAIRDVTERRRAERMLRERQEELAHVMRVAAAGEMVTGLAHELNQPLYSITNYARGCIYRLNTSSIEKREIHQIAEEIEREAKRAAEIIRRLRRMVQKREPIETSFHVNHTIEEACRLVQSDLEQRSVYVERDLDASLPETSGDDIQLQQVIVNLLRNAADAMRDTANGERAVHVTSRLDDTGIARICVSDSGTGIPPEDLERIFDAFHSTSEAGMGMGLAISRTIIESHGGRIWARNNREGGATISLTLPIRGEKPNEA